MSCNDDAPPLLPISAAAAASAAASAAAYGDTDPTCAIFTGFSPSLSPAPPPPLSLLTDGLTIEFILTFYTYYTYIYFI